MQTANVQAASVIVLVTTDATTAFNEAVGYGQDMPPPPDVPSHLIAMTWLSVPAIKHLVTSVCPPFCLPVQTSQFVEMLETLPLSGTIVLSASATRKGNEIILSYKGEDGASGLMITRGEIGFIFAQAEHMNELVL